MRTVVVLVCLALAGVGVEGEPVDVYAGDFIAMDTHPLRGFRITHEETGKGYVTDDTGYLHLDFPAGTNLTFTLEEQSFYKATQTATVTVPVGGLTGHLKEIVLQVPDDPTFVALEVFLPHRLARNWSQCLLVVTVCNFNTTWTDIPQGYEGVTASLHPPGSEFPPYYFGTWGSISNKTDPLPNSRMNTSWDGGVLWQNIDPSVEDYTVTAHFKDVPFSTSRIRCIRPGILINAAPNMGPRAQKPIV
eukprot:Hpha_TRINITY_DN5531_c0_g1::TRINITY_DN5531_c0_g1_i1::g.93831::m.93831